MEKRFQTFLDVLFEIAEKDFVQMDWDMALCHYYDYFTKRFSTDKSNHGVSDKELIGLFNLIEAISNSLKRDKQFQIHHFNYVENIYNFFNIAQSKYHKHD